VGLKILYCGFVFNQHYHAISETGIFLSFILFFLNSFTYSFVCYMMLSVSHTAQYQMTGLLVTVSELIAKTLGHEAEVLTT